MATAAGSVWPAQRALLVLGRAGIAEKMFPAIERGNHVNQDLSGKWDYWAYAMLPSDEVRRRLNNLPK
jgi:hypothetical protein